MVESGADSRAFTPSAKPFEAQAKNGRDTSVRYLWGEGSSVTVFLAIGIVGILLLLVALVIGDHFDGVLDALGGGDWFTGAALAGFLGGVGFVGAGIEAITGNVWLAILGGLLGGLALGFAVGWLTLRLRNGGGDSTPTSAGLVGLVGTVVSEIPAEGYGVISLVNRGHPTRVNARCIEPLAPGTSVTVTEVLSPTSVKVVQTYR